MTGEPTGTAAVVAPQRRLPPVTEVAVATMALVVLGGIYLAAYLPRRAPLGPAEGLLGAAGALLAWNVVSLSRVRAFAWNTFFVVAGWALVGYVVIAGTLEYVFVLDHTRGTLLVVLTLMLAIFAVNTPMLFGFSVARYQAAGRSAEVGRPDAALGAQSEG